MNRTLSLTLATLAATFLMGTAAYADDAADAKAAIKKLADSPNYAWTSTTENVAAAGAAAPGGGRGGRGRGGPPAGKIEKDGYATFTLTIQQQPYDVVIHGTKAVAKMTDGWKTKEELQKAAEAAAAAAAGGGGPGGFGPENQILNQINNFKSPVTQATEIAEKFTNVKKTADGYTADIAEDTAKTLATPPARGGRGARGATPPAPATVTGAKGTLAVTVKDGVATKLVIHLEGSLSFNDQPFPINRNTTIEIKEVGATKQEIPAEAKAKLDSIK